MIEPNMDLRKQIFKLQAQKNLAQNINSLQQDQLQINNNEVSIRQKSLTGQILLPEPLNTSKEGQDQAQRPRFSTSIKRSSTNQYDGQENISQGQKQIRPSQIMLKRSDSAQIPKETNSSTSPTSPLSPTDEQPIEAKTPIRAKSRIMSLLSKGLLKQIQPQKNNEKQEQIKRLRAILSKNIKQRDENEIDYLQECYKERIDFFKTIQVRYGLTTLRKVFQVMRYETIEKNQKIFSKGEKGEKFYIILSGKVKVATQNNNNNNSMSEINSPITSHFPSNFSKSQSPKRDSKPLLQNKSLFQINSPRQDQNQSPEKSARLDSSFSSRKRSLTQNKSQQSDTSPRNKSTTQGNLKISTSQQNESQFKQRTSISNSPVISSRKSIRNSLLSNMFQFSPNSQGTQEFKRRLNKLQIDQIINQQQLNLDEEMDEEEIQNLTVIRELGKGESFGEMSMRPGKNNLRTATAFTQEKCEFAVISRHDYNLIITPLELQNTKEKIEFLKQLPLLSKWDKKDLKLLSYCLHELQIPKNNHLFKEGENSKDLFIIQAGKINLIRNQNIYF